jgi:hypothetical protein
VSQAAAITAVRQRFIDQVATPQELVVVYDNAPEPATSNPRARVTITLEDEVQLTMGLRKWRATGVMEVQLMQPRERGDAALLTLAQAVVDAFRGQRIASPLVRFNPPPYMAGAMDTEDATVRRTVRVPFLCDFAG